MIETQHFLRRTLRMAAVVLPLAVVSGCFGDRPSIVLITVDTLRPDRLGAYGYAKIETPTIDRLAREGMLFEDAYCDMPWTTGSMSSVMTGQYSSSHGVDLPNVRLKDEAVTMPEILGSKGYRTGAIIGSFPLDSVFGLDQGFQTYDDTFTKPMLFDPKKDVEHVPSQAPDVPDEGFGLRKFQNDSYRSDDEVTDAAIEWIDKTVRAEPESLLDYVFRRPYFLWVHYFGPHEKLRADEGIVPQEPRMIAEYDGDVEEMDSAVGRLLDHLRKDEALDEMLVILHSDHGQNLGEFGVVGHGQRIDEATTRIPLILRYPKRIPAGLRRVDIARNIDILPTVLDVLDDRIEGLAGRSLIPSDRDLKGAAFPPELQIAYFATKQTTIFHQPVPALPGGTVLGPVARSGLRTPTWRYTEDQVVGDCTIGAKARRDAMGAWQLKDGRPLDPATCLNVKGRSLYAVSLARDAEPNVIGRHRDTANTLSEKLAKHLLDVAPLGSKFELSAEQQEKLRSLGYLK